MKRLLLGILFVLFLSSYAFAVNTVTTSVDYYGKLVTVQVVPDAGTAWDSPAAYTNGLNVAAILFVPSAANDRLVVRDVAAGGNVIFNDISLDGGSRVLYIGRRIKPYILKADCTLGTPANVRIVFILQ